MLTPKDVENKIANHLRLHSGLEERRGYLGISQIPKCPREAYRNYVNGVDTSDFHHRMCYAGYLYEFDVLQRLREIHVAVLDRREVVSGFDERLRGHVDGLTAWGDLLEIKSLSVHKFQAVQQLGEPLREHNDQVQLYMRYGGWKFAWIVYVCRENMQHKVIKLAYDKARADELEMKAKMMLKAIDSGKEPACECGKCKKD